MATAAQEEADKGAEEPTVIGKPDETSAGPAVQLISDTARSQMKLVQGRTAVQVLNSTSFAAGLSWRTAVVLIINRDNVSYLPGESDALAMWVAAFGVIMLLIMLMIAVFARCQRLRRQIASAKEAQDRETEVACKAKLMTYDLVLSWGLSFAVAAQLNAALDATIPDDPKSMRVVSFASLLAVVVSFSSALVACLGPSKKKDASESLAVQITTMVISGSAYFVALEFLSMTAVLFKMEGEAESDDLGDLIVYAVAVLVATSAILAGAAVFDKQDALQASHALVEGHTTRGRGCCSWIRINMRLTRGLIPRVASMAAVCAMYSVLYMLLAKRIDENATLTSALAPGEAGMLVAAALIFSVSIGFLVQCALEDAALRVSAIDRQKIPGKFDDAALAMLQKLMQNTASAVVEACAWVLGCSLNALGLALLSDHLDILDQGQGILFAVAVAAIFTVLAWVAMCCLPPPPQAPALGAAPEVEKA